MAQNITLLGASYPAVPAVQLPKTGGGTATFTDVTDTTAAAADVASGKYFYTAAGVRTQGTNSGGGGSDRLVLLNTTDLGTLSTTSTSAQNTGKTIVLSSSSGWDAYDLLICTIGVGTTRNGYHVGTTTFILNSGTTRITTKNASGVVSNALNIKVSSSGVISSASSTTKYGVYIYSTSLSNGQLTLSVYYRYNNNHTATLNGDYTAKVYGVNIADLFGI